MPNSLPVEFTRLKRQVDQIKKGQRLSHGASIENAVLEVKDGTGSLRTIMGPLGDGSVGVQPVNGPPPPQPSAPAVASVLGGVSAGWDGLFANGAVIPMDFSRIEVHASVAAVFEPIPETLRSTIETAQGATVVVPTADPVYVRLVARSTSGTASIPSAVVGPFGPSPVVANDILDGIVTEQKLAADAVTEAKIAAGAVTLNTLGGALGDTASQRYVDYFRDPDSWAQLYVTSGGSFDIDPTPVGTPSGGGRLIATGEVQVAAKALIPQDSDTLYRVMVRVRATAQDPTGPATVYLGAVGVAQDGVTLVNRAGANSNSTQHYCCTAGSSLGTAGGWTTYVGWIQGHGAAGATPPAGPATDPRAPELTHADVKYLRPMAWLNFGKTTASVMEVEAVTVEAVRTGVVGSSNLVSGSVTTGALAADAVTTPKLAAGAVQALQIDAGAVNTDKLAAGAVTTAKLDALAVTADKIAANAITADKILAGSITATALSATAIDGKTITGAVIQTAATGQRITLNEGGLNKILLYDATGAVGELSGNGFAVKGDAGGLISIIPDATSPYLSWSNPTQTNRAYAQVVGPNPADANLELISGAFTGNTYNDMRWRLYLANDAVNLERLRGTNPNTRIGGRFWASATYASIGVANTDTPTAETNLNVESTVGTLYQGCLQVYAPPTSTRSVVYGEAPTGFTTPLLRLVRGSVDKFSVDKDGNTAIAGKMTAGNIVTGTATVTPTAANTPTAYVISGFNVAGSTFTGFVTANSTVPAPSTGAGGTPNGVNGVTINAVSATSATLWVNRQNTTATNVNWMIVGS